MILLMNLIVLLMVMSSAFAITPKDEASFFFGPRRFRALMKELNVHKLIRNQLTSDNEIVASVSAQVDSALCRHFSPSDYKSIFFAIPEIKVDSIQKKYLSLDQKYKPIATFMIAFAGSYGRDASKPSTWKNAIEIISNLASQNDQVAIGLLRTVEEGRMESILLNFGVAERIVRNRRNRSNEYFTYIDNAYASNDFRGPFVNAPTIDSEELEGLFKSKWASEMDRNAIFKLASLLKRNLLLARPSISINEYNKLEAFLRNFDNVPH